jgi:hypothetical protein
MVGALVAVVGHWRPPAPAPDIGGWLQQRLDRGGGLIFLPRLGGGRCYTSRGLWVSHSDTTIASNGACLLVVGAGPVRLRSADGDPIAASAAFFVSRSAPTARPPHHIRIRGLRIHVPSGALDGIDVYGQDVWISNVRVDGAPFDDIYIGGRTNLIDFSRAVTLTGSTLLGAERNVISVTAAVQLQISGNLIAGAGVGVGTAADPGAGIDVEPNGVRDPIIAVRIADNRIVGNVHEGIALRLRPPGSRSVDAHGVRVVENRFAGNYPFGGGAQITVSPGATSETTRVLIARNRFAAGGPHEASLGR